MQKTFSKGKFWPFQLVLAQRGGLEEELIVPQVVLLPTPLPDRNPGDNQKKGSATKPNDGLR
jgi:hypothetical protein